MKLKFPKKIMVGCIELIVKTDKARVGGEFYYWDEPKKKKVEKGKLIIGTKLLKTNPSWVLGTIIHELKEAIQAEQNTRYKRGDTKTDYEFHYDHKEHTDLCSRLAGLLKQFID